MQRQPLEGQATFLVYCLLLYIVLPKGRPRFLSGGVPAAAPADAAAAAAPAASVYEGLASRPAGKLFCELKFRRICAASRSGASSVLLSTSSSSRSSSGSCSSSSSPAQSRVVTDRHVRVHTFKQRPTHPHLAWIAPPPRTRQFFFFSLYSPFPR